MASLEDLRTIAIWGGRFVRSAPGAGVDMLRLAIDRRITRKETGPRIMVATHHKVLSVFMRRVFRSFSAVTARQFATGKGGEIPVSSEVFHAHHSQVDFSRYPCHWIGVHMRRDPRDLLVSSTLYHLRHRTGEAWLHTPRSEFGGATYQQKLRSLPTMEEQLLFEIGASGGNNIQDMLDWTYGQPGITEFRYEDMIGPDAETLFAEAVKSWPLTDLEANVLVELFRFYSLGGAGVRKDHIRNPSPGQWKKHFSPRVTAAFEARFPGATTRLGYEGLAE